jgi:hypothetical protein
MDKNHMSGYDEDDEKKLDASEYEEYPEKEYEESVEKT